MGLTTDYPSYVPAGILNIIAGKNSPIVFVTIENQEGRFMAVGACEEIVIWDLKLREKVKVLSGSTSVVTSICVNPNKQHIVGGYQNGDIHVYDLKTAELISNFLGHKSDITALAFDHQGHTLASGSKDTEIIVWDIIAEIGICRLSGHTGPITQISFMAKYPYLVSTAKDGFVKFWDLDTQHCFKTLTGHRTEVWGFVLVKKEQYLVTGCGDAELRVWRLTHKDLSEEKKDTFMLHLNTKLEPLESGDLDDLELTHPLQCINVGSLYRIGKGRVVNMVSDVSGQVLACHGTDNFVEFFYFCPEDEVQIRFKKRLKKETKKNLSTKEPSVLSLMDEVIRLPNLTTSVKVKSVNLMLGNRGELRIAVNLANNTLELHSLHIDSKENPKTLSSICDQGHRGEIRTVAFSSDTSAFVSGSDESVKLWNRSSNACVRTIATGSVLCCAFLPGDRFVLAGLKSGALLVIDISTADIIENIPAHTLELWSLCLHEQKGCVTASGDKTVKFWELSLIDDTRNERKASVLSLLHTRTLSLNDCVLCVKISPNNKFIAAALMDFTVKLFFVDTLKFFLSLYGHRLPVLCMDISSDSTLIATGSGDRNIKIWGVNFGECLKNIFAHEDSITGLQFVPGTHWFFTSGRDGKIKQWDADHFNKITTLRGHFGAAWSLAISPNGTYFISSGADGCLRLYQKSDSVIVRGDEQLEQEDAIEEQSAVDPNFVSRKTLRSETAAERLLESLEAFKFDREKDSLTTIKADSLEQYPPKISLLMRYFGVRTSEHLFLETIKRINASDIEEALLLLPFTAVCETLTMLPPLIVAGVNVELLCKVCVFFMKQHQGSIIANRILLNVLNDLRKKAFEGIYKSVDLFGENYFYMQFLRQKMLQRRAQSNHDWSKKQNVMRSKKIIR